MSPDPLDALGTHLGRLARAFACGVLATVVLCATARPAHAAGPLASALQRVRASSAVGREVADALATGAHVRVMIALREPALGARAALPQRAAAIASTVDGVLGRLPGSAFTLARRFQHVSALAGTIDVAGVAALLDDP